MQLVTAQNNLSQCLFLAVTQWESRLPVIKDGVREFFNAVPKIMHFIYSLAVLAWYTLVALGALGGFLIVGFFGLMRRSHYLGKKARSSNTIVQLEVQFHQFAQDRVLPVFGKLATYFRSNFLQFAKKS